MTEENNSRPTQRHPDLDITAQYFNKSRSCQSRGIDFMLSFSEYKALRRRNKCQYSGLPLTPETFSIERLDDRVGYTKENCIVCHSDLNRIKGLWEKPDSEICAKDVFKMLKTLDKRGIL